MTSGPSTTPASNDLNDIETIVQAQAQRSADNSTELLQLLRLLETLHRNIREDLFIKTLPTNRQALHVLLKEIETAGGWPYIPKMRLKSLMAKLYAEESTQQTD